MRKRVAPRPAPLQVLGPEVYRTGSQPSASRSDIILNCVYWVGRENEYEVPSEPARYGTAFHELMAAYIARAANLKDAPPLPHPVKLVKKLQLADETSEELSVHTPMAFKHLREWLTKNEYKIDFLKGEVLVEYAIALLPLRHARRIDPPDEHHRYHGLVEGELPGTADLIILFPDFVLVLDHKTGDEEDFSDPLSKPQLLTLAAGCLRLFGRKRGYVGVLHSRRRGLPKVYSEPVTLKELEAHEAQLQKSLNRINDGSMKPGTWCKWCPGRETCPARDGQLLKTAGEVLNGLTAAGGALSSQGLTANDVAMVKAPAADLSREKKLGLLYSVIKKAEVLAKRARDEIKKELEADKRLLPVTPDNEYLVIRTYEKENLSKQAVIEAYGKIQGERVLNKLRKDGAMPKSTVVQLWPEKERGR